MRTKYNSFASTVVLGGLWRQNLLKTFAANAVDRLNCKSVFESCLLHKVYALLENAYFLSLCSLFDTRSVVESVENKAENKTGKIPTTNCRVFADRH